MGVMGYVHVSLSHSSQEKAVHERRIGRCEQVSGECSQCQAHFIYLVCVSLHAENSGVEE